jgi:hypothetical protein
MELKKISVYIAVFILVFSGGCTPAGNKNEKSMNNNEMTEKGTYGYDVAFLAKHNIETIELTGENSGAKVLVAPGWQGRVMTSSAEGNEGASFGWINYSFIEKGEVSGQFNPVGGEERFWLGPEGGPFSVYFKPGDEQVFSNWKVPAELDTQPFEVVEKTPAKVSFKSQFSLVNATGTSLDLGVERTVRLLSKPEAENVLKLSLDSSLNFVAFETVNTLKNAGETTWNEKNGFLSVWLLCMFNPSEQGVVFIPFREGDETALGKKVTDDYFGKVPEDRLIVKENRLFFKIDGKFRSKIGISPERALPFCGSYDAGNRVLTLLQYSQPQEPARYVNSKWGEQDDPLKGDVVNSYNDGPAGDGKVMGPFYEIESSSPAALLSPGQEITHTQRIFHISGEEARLNEITVNLFGITLNEIKTVF